ncbi:MAG: 2OG-Fe(II) oxygenase [Rhodospirillales bacterium]|nr:2OG-Fe(II) oxygenase [Rhodospirillales bacterium]
MCNARYFSYLPGERVIKHIDGADKLTSAVLYLTKDWQPACSGELEVDFEGQTVAIRPLRGRVVIVGPDVPHGSRAVASGTRTCIVFFYARSPAG